MTTDSFEKLFSTFSSGQTERRSQLAKDLLSLFSEEGLLNAESEEYRCVMSAIEDIASSHNRAYALSGPRKRTLSFFGRKSQERSSRDPISQAAKLLRGTSPHAINSTYENVERRCFMRLRDLNEYGLIYDSSDRCMSKSLSYRGYECLSKPLRALGGEALELKDDVRPRLRTASHPAPVEMMKPIAVGLVMRIVELICKKSFKFPTFAPEYVKLVQQASGLVARVRDCLCSKPESTSSPVDVASACIDLKQMHQKMDAIVEIPAKPSLYGGALITEFGIRQEQLEDQGQFVELLTSEEHCGFPIVSVVKCDFVARGAFNNVETATISDGATLKIVAVKTAIVPFDKSIEPWRIRLRIIREAHLCKKAKTDSEGSQFIVSLLGIWFPEPNALPSLVMEYAQEGDLSCYMKDSRNTLQDRLIKCHEIILGVKHLHSLKPRIVHGDLKADNIIIVNRSARLCDFGLSRVNIPKTGMTTGTKSYSECYRAPELYIGTGLYATGEADVYAYGCVFLELLSGSSLDSIRSQLEGLRERHGTPIHRISDADSGLDQITPELFSGQLFEGQYMALLTGCFEFHAKDRPTAEDLVKDVQSFL